MLHHQRSTAPISLATILWLLVSAFSLILIFFGTKVDNIHRSILLDDEIRSMTHFRDEVISLRVPNGPSQPGNRRLNVVPSPTSAPSSSATTLPTPSPITTKRSSPCQWYPPYDQMASYPQFDEHFRALKDFDVQDAIKFITKISKRYCTTFSHGYSFHFDDVTTNSVDLNPVDSVRIAIATVIILPSKRPKNLNDSTLKIDIFKDIRTYIFRMDNALRYAQQHGYDLIVQTSHIFEYRYPFNSQFNRFHSDFHSESERNRYEEWMKGATFQKPFLMEQYLSDYEWMVWMDYDTIFLNCNNKIQDIIHFAQHTHPRRDGSDGISLIFGAERFATINAGVWMMKNSEWSHSFLRDWMYLEQNAEKFQILKADDVHRDQPLFVALLQGFDVRKSIGEDTWRDLKYHNDLAQKKYLETKLKLDFEDMLRRPIWDDINAQYAVAIDEALINAKTPHFNKGAAKTLDVDMRYMWIMHFYWKFKYRTKTVFKAFQYSLEHCSFEL